jgi:putative flippase GtrA
MGEILRYAVNGLICTLIHFGVLTFNIKFLEFESTGLANIIASVIGISSSYLGNKYFVFQGSKTLKSLLFPKFFLTYSLIALFHGLSLYVWSDICKLDYKLGFVMAVIIQFVLGFLLSKFIIFKKYEKE